jgi:hypothetical protein
MHSVYISQMTKLLANKEPNLKASLDVQAYVLTILLTPPLVPRLWLHGLHLQSAAQPSICLPLASPAPKCD